MASLLPPAPKAPGLVISQQLPVRNSAGKKAVSSSRGVSPRVVGGGGAGGGIAPPSLPVSALQELLLHSVQHRGLGSSLSQIQQQGAGQADNQQGLHASPTLGAGAAAGRVELKHLLPVVSTCLPPEAAANAASWIVAGTLQQPQQQGAETGSPSLHLTVHMEGASSKGGRFEDESEQQEALSIRLLWLFASAAAQPGAAAAAAGAAPSPSAPSLSQAAALLAAAIERQGLKALQSRRQLQDSEEGRGRGSARSYAMTVSSSSLAKCTGQAAAELLQAPLPLLLAGACLQDPGVMAAAGRLLPGCVAAALAEGAQTPQVKAMQAQEHAVLLRAALAYYQAVGQQQWQQHGQLQGQPSLHGLVPGMLLPKVVPLPAQDPFLQGMLASQPMQASLSAALPHVGAESALRLTGLLTSLLMYTAGMPRASRGDTVAGASQGSITGAPSDKQQQGLHPFWWGSGLEAAVTAALPTMDLPQAMQAVNASHGLGIASALAAERLGALPRGTAVSSSGDEAVGAAGGEGAAAAAAAGASECMMATARMHHAALLQSLRSLAQAAATSASEAVPEEDQAAGSLPSGNPVLVGSMMGGPEQQQLLEALRCSRLARSDVLLQALGTGSAAAAPIQGSGLQGGRGIEPAELAKTAQEVSGVLGGLAAKQLVPTAAAAPALLGLVGMCASLLSAEAGTFTPSLADAAHADARSGPEPLQRTLNSLLSQSAAIAAPALWGAASTKGTESRSSAVSLELLTEVGRWVVLHEHSQRPEVRGWEPSVLTCGLLW